MDFYLKNKMNPNGSMRVENLFHSFSEANGTVQVLNGVSLEAKPGEITSIAGPSGCGKSTLLYLMGLLDRPDSGKVFMGDSEVQNLEDDERTKARNHFIGFVFQFHFLIKELSVLENVALPIRKTGETKDIAKARAKSAEAKPNVCKNKSAIIAPDVPIQFDMLSLVEAVLKDGSVAS